MAFYLFKANYSADAIKAMVDQPTDREAAGRKAIEALGGTLHSFYFALGEADAIAIFEVPDDKVAVAVSLAVSASGAFKSVSTTKLMTSAEAMEAMGKAKEMLGAYAPPTG